MNTLKSGVFVIFSVWIICSADNTRDTDNMAGIELRQMKRMYTDLLHEHKKLQRRMGRIDMVYRGLKKMCKFFAEYKMESKDKQSKKEREAQIEIQSVSSSGLNIDGSVNVTIAFICRDRIKTRWSIMYKNEQHIIERGKISSENQQCVASFQIPNIEEANFIEIYLESGRNHVVMFIIANELTDQVDEELLLNATLKTNPDKSYRAEDGEDLVLSLPVTVDGYPLIRSEISKQELAAMRSSITASFTFVNTSTMPHSFAYISTPHADYKIDISFSEAKDKLRTSNRRNDGTNQQVALVIRIDEEYVKYGGILSLLVTGGTTARMIEEIYEGKKIYILSSNDNHPFPEGSLAMGEMDIRFVSTTFVSASLGSLTCSALGNPTPKVTMLKVHKQEGLPPRPMKTTNFKTKFLVMKTLNFRHVRSKALKGTYICRISNGNATLESNTTIEELRPAMFDDENTGLMANNSDETVISCVASGNPRPALKILTWPPYGSDLSDKFHTTSKNTGKYSSKILMTIPGNDTSVSEVYCYAKQTEVGIQTQKKIFVKSIIPENTENNWYNVSYYGDYL